MGDNSAMYVPKVDLSFDALQDEVAQMKAARVAQDQVIQALQDGMANQAKEIAMLTAAIQANHEVHQEARRLGVRQELDVVIKEVATITTNIDEVNATVQVAVAAIEDNAASIEGVNSTVQENVASIETVNADVDAVNTTVQANAASIEEVDSTVQENVASIETVNATVQDNAASIKGVNSTVQANVAAIDDNSVGINAVSSDVQTLEAQLEKAVTTLNASISVANDCCTETTAALIRGDADGDGVSDLNDGCPNDKGSILFGPFLNDTSQCGTYSPSISSVPSETPSQAPSTSQVPSITPSLTPSVSLSPTLAPTTVCQGSITTDPDTGSEYFLIFSCLLNLCCRI